MAKAKSKAAVPPVIYPDACVYVDLLTKRTVLHPDTLQPRWQSAKALFDAVDDGRVVLATSSLIDAEVCCFSHIRDGGDDINDKLRGWFDSSDTRYAEVDRLLVRDAIRISTAIARQFPQAKQPNPADAVHIAAAARLEAEYLVTQDDGFPIGATIDGVRIRRPEKLWQPTVFDDD
ncbi:PIN domain-containing protein [Mycolicibacterium mucogenicum]|jgi:predicted nucleic acid-binding protein|uniref:PIN domain-containing protein n=1 Tax=Mycolicibacterium mucogenicum TaxID=56689 RepID=A0A4R5WH32_MYCMU|nr:PIN domain-containing protein [Mycolicibacterium mucogenicum]MCX8557867.1 PIN domain-containing protein [Mycolicibacterium mucogenicum]TDK89598.1 PIN domain-containing protein [Mycolicibacterium mucogenicum]TXH17183.1 MAG: PIN domain-containing protein [Mycobacterium sp.]